MSSRKRAPYDIAVVGLGMAGIHQVTREAEETIRRCTQTYLIDMAIGVADYLRTLCPVVTDLRSRYETGAHRISIYRRMASEVVNAALEDPPVCLATYGHPKLFCYPTTLVERTAMILDLKVTVLPGISFLDALLVDLGFDPGFDGLQMYEATDLVIRRRPLQADVPCVIVQAPIVLDAYNRPEGPSLENLAILQSHLLQFYASDHIALNLLSKTHPLLNSLTQRIPLGRLATALAKGSNVGTLFIPPVQHREVAEPGLAERMQLRADTSDDDATPTGRRPGRPEIGPQPS